MSSLDDPAFWNERGAPFLFGHLGVEVLEASATLVRARIELREHHMAPNGYLHAGTVVTLADSCCGVGTMNGLPEGASGFTTIELKSNHLGTALDGEIACVATRTHAGRTTQVWDAVVTGPGEKTIALFRCTQMVLYPR